MATTNWQNIVGKQIKRIHNKTLANLRDLYSNKGVTMTKRAKVLSAEELAKAIKYCATTRYQLRNSC